MPAHPESRMKRRQVDRVVAERAADGVDIVGYIRGAVAIARTPELLSAHADSADHDTHAIRGEVLERRAIDRVGATFASISPPRRCRRDAVVASRRPRVAAVFAKLEGGRCRPPSIGNRAFYGWRGWLRPRTARLPAVSTSAIAAVIPAPIAASPQSKPLLVDLSVGAAVAMGWTVVAWVLRSALW